MVDSSKQNPSAVDDKPSDDELKGHHQDASQQLGVALSNEDIIKNRPDHGDTMPTTETVLEAKDLVIKYGDFAAIKGVNMKISEHRVTALIGPSGCGKSTFLRHLNRMNEFIEGVNMDGQVLYRGNDLYGKDVDPVEVRRRIGMVFQKPNPFPKSIYENIAWGPKINRLVDRKDIPELVETSLKRANLWDEVKDRLNESGLGMSGGQQQRLCIARTIAMKPEVILMDEPCSALDPMSTAAIEDLIFELKEEYTIVIVTHNMQQAARVSDYTGFFVTGDLIEYGETNQIFTRPHEKRTEEYVTGRFG
jgi:phosphate transport system ATP-binding protein